MGIFLRQSTISLYENAGTVFCDKGQVNLKDTVPALAHIIDFFDGETIDSEGADCKDLPVQTAGRARPDRGSTDMAPNRCHAARMAKKTSGYLPSAA